jgi:hypothetical protein
MITIPELAAEALGSHLAGHLDRRFGSTDKDLPTLIQIGEKSGTLTPFGSLGGASHSVGSDDSAHRRTVYRRFNSIKLAWGWICNLFLAVWQHAAFKTH